MAYLLDTCIISAFFRKEPQLIERLESITPDDLKISTITVMEIEYGLHLNPSIRSRIQPLWLSFKEQVEVLPFSEGDAVHAAQIRSILKKEGRLIGPYDILLAGTSKNHNLVFVTDNLSEFKRVEGLQVENWIKTN
jgi:tRNA(fMet)-specific endonuclease VapC